MAAAITQHLNKGGGSHQQITKYAEIVGNRAYTLSAYPEAQHHYEVAIAYRIAQMYEMYKESRLRALAIPPHA